MRESIVLRINTRIRTTRKGGRVEGNKEGRKEKEMGEKSNNFKTIESNSVTLVPAGLYIQQDAT